MKSVTFLMLLPLTMTVYGQDWGVGVRVGDPAGLTVKKYMDERAIELSIGSANLFYDKGLFNKYLHNWFMSRSLKDQEFEYSINKASVPFGFQVHFLNQKDISYTTPALKWYYGIGGQFRVQKCSYNFRYKIPGNPVWHDITGEMVTDVDMGIDGIIGMEYSPSKIPISIFLDLNLFMELGDDPFILWVQGGAGLRYNFGGSINPISLQQPGR